MGSPRDQSQNHKNPQIRLHSLFQDPTANDKVTDHHKWLCTSQEQLPDRGITCTYAKISCRTGQNSEMSRLVQLTFLGSQAQQSMETYRRPQNSLMSAKMRISLISWIVSIETDLMVGAASPPGTFFLVLHQITKSPFEPLKVALLKHLVLKTVFLLALRSGTYRSDINAWLNKNIRHQTD